MQICMCVQLDTASIGVLVTLKPLLRGHSKIDINKILMTNGSLMQVESIAKCSPWTVCNTFDLHLAIICLEINLVFFFEWLLKTDFTVYNLIFEDKHN